MYVPAQLRMNVCFVHQVQDGARRCGPRKLVRTVAGDHRDARGTPQSPRAYWVPEKTVFVVENRN